MRAISGSVVAKRTSVLPELWFVILGVTIALVVGMVFLVVAGALVPNGSVPGLGYVLRGMRRRMGRARRYWQLSRISRPTAWPAGFCPSPSSGSCDVVVYSIAPAVSGTAFWRVSKMTLLTRTKIRNSTNAMRSRTSPNEAMTPPRPKP
jgi:hypothetical protein